MSYFFDRIKINPIIAAINELDQLDEALESPCEIVFLLTGNIFNLKEIANRIKSKDKGLYINIDLIDGFSKDTWGLEYIVKNIYPDGIITAKENLVRLSKDLGAFTILRLFVVDSISLEKGIQSVKATRPHALEIFPGIMPKITKMVHTETETPIIASGLIMDKEDVVESLNSSAIAVSSNNKHVWYI
ncbi:glycerol-3-phosphate responsive antiterminator [Clostridium sp. Cult2]|uniref:glycerol-3-phosphate responsive antiterminator n=1 Tax=Clostridium sp. Cult2 TaxID=2079003 RepID=UPI001F45EF59|nr:glycerol-3-phosphate responsive antiterminator [Clostridium sp. Cult2]MCF6466776.1 glycerol-3-phosphate responsive antiterminator [Clostridium sp. Cult2]